MKILALTVLQQEILLKTVRQTLHFKFGLTFKNMNCYEGLELLHATSVPISLIGGLAHV